MKNLKINKSKLINLIITVFGTLIMMLCLVKYLGFVLSLGIFLIFCLINFVILNKRKDDKSYSKYKFFISVLNSFIISIIFSYIFSIHDLVVFPIYRIASIPFGIIAFYNICYFISSISSKQIEKHKIEVKDVLIMYLSLGALIYLFFVFLPFDTLLNNYNEYTFPCVEIFFSTYLFVFVPLIIPFMLSFLNKKIYKIISNLFLGLLIGVYFQFSFMNRYIGQLNGANYNWKDHIVFSIINLFVWIICFAFPWIMGKLFKNVIKEISIVVCGVIFLVSLLALSFDFVKAPEGAHQYKMLSLSGEKQYKISPNGNAIIFVIDALDNEFLKEIYNDNPVFFNELKDFTFYTNTCSVYDLTNLSHAQFMAGEYFESDKIGFEDYVYPRMIENGYSIEFFSISTMNCPKLRPYIENYKGFEVSADGRIQSLWLDNDFKKRITIRNNLISKYCSLITVYQVFPCILKGIVNLDSVDFTICLTDINFTLDCYNRNDSFDEHLYLSLDDTDKSYFIFQSISGVHFPCDDYIEGSKDCLNIFKKYIKQLQEIDAYDDATIILLADHGIHDGVEGVPYPTAATPMLMIKEPNSVHDNIVLNDAPVYHEDIIPTVLYNIGLYDSESDPEIIGRPVYYYKEGDLRERVWFDGDFDLSSRHKYSYIGTTKDLEYVVNNNIFEKADYVIADGLIADEIE